MADKPYPSDWQVLVPLNDLIQLQGLLPELEKLRRELGAIRNMYMELATLYGDVKREMGNARRD